MKRFILLTLLVLLPLGVAPLSFSQATPDEAACQQAIQKNCVKCHATDRICDELAEAGANWPHIIKEMGEKGKLSQEVQDTVLNCLTKSADPAKLVCKKK